MIPVAVSEHCQLSCGYIWTFDYQAEFGKLNWLYCHRRSPQSNLLKINRTRPRTYMNKRLWIYQKVDKMSLVWALCFMRFTLNPALSRPAPRPGWRARHSQRHCIHNVLYPGYFPKIIQPILHNSMAARYRRLDWFWRRYRDPWKQKQFTFMRSFRRRPPSKKMYSWGEKMTLLRRVLGLSGVRSSDIESVRSSLLRDDFGNMRTPTQFCGQNNLLLEVKLFRFFQAVFQTCIKLILNRYILNSSIRKQSF